MEKKDKAFKHVDSSGTFAVKIGKKTHETHKLEVKREKHKVKSCRDGNMRKDHAEARGHAEEVY